MAEPDQDRSARDALEALAAENLRLQRLVGELLLKNQRLREAATTELSGRDARSFNTWTSLL